MKAVDFSNTEIAFAYKTDRQLRRAARLFRLINRPRIVRFLSGLGIWGVKVGVPFVEGIIRRTLYTQFVGGAHLEDVEAVIRLLADHGCFSVLDFAVEGKNEEEELDAAAEEFLAAIRFATRTESVSVVTVKVSALAPNQALETWNNDDPAEAPDPEMARVYQRLDRICRTASEGGVSVFIDAEQSWYQDAIDDLATQMMRKYNRDRVVVYQTYQMYRKDRLDYLQNDFEKARKEGYLLGAKLVRGAYLDGERERARARGYPDPILPDKPSVDRHFNSALLFCADRHEHISVSAATHNLISSKLLADKIEELGLPRNHPRFHFCQLYGMGDDMTFNLARAGYNAAKYLPYGPVKEVLPYLIRRMEENQAMSYEFNREYQLIVKELKRRSHQKKQINTK